MATGFDNGERKCSGLSAWLLKHGRAAAVESLHVQGHVLHSIGGSGPQLQLPVQQLAALNSLQLDVPVVFHQGTGSQQASTAALPQELSALTRLELRKCRELDLESLPAFTLLQQLCLTGAHRCVEAHELAPLASALPSMQQLTHLELGDSFTQDAIVSSVQHLPRLQVLLLQMSNCSIAALAELPQSITWLRLHHSTTAPLTLSHSSTPGIAKLTALQRLEAFAYLQSAVQPLFLAAFPNLQHLAVTSKGVAAAAGEPGFAALNTLTKLQHLNLCFYEDTMLVAATPADCAALAASSQLSALVISHSRLVAGNKYIHVFPEGRCLPHLHQLDATMGLLGDAQAVWQLVKACPNLENLHLNKRIAGEPGGVVAHNAAFGEVPCHSVCILSGLSKLTTLHLDIKEQEDDWGDSAWQGLGRLTTLKRLIVGTVEPQALVAMTALTTCRQLTYLSVECEDVDSTAELEVKNTVRGMWLCF